VTPRSVIGTLFTALRSRSTAPAALVTDVHSRSLTYETPGGAVNRAVSYGVCESTVSAYSASRKLVERTLQAETALGITVVVAAGDTGPSACPGGGPPRKPTSPDKKPPGSRPR